MKHQRLEEESGTVHTYKNTFMIMYKSNKPRKSALPGTTDAETPRPFAHRDGGKVVRGVTPSSSTISQSSEVL